nr:unnamed protein product [Callosobruchus analis]
MYKGTPLKYPNLRRKTLEAKQNFIVYEPERKTLYDSVVENLKLSNRITYLNRLIYMGAHKNPTTLPIMFEESIIQQTARYQDDSALSDSEPGADSRSSMDLGSSTGRSFGAVESKTGSSAPRYSTASLRRFSGMIQNRFWQHLPETEVLEVLLTSPYTQTLKEFSDLYMQVPQREIYNDKVWPAPDEYVPFDIFAPPFNMVTELPRQNDMRETVDATDMNSGN